MRKLRVVMGHKPGPWIPEQDWFSTWQKTVGMAADKRAESVMVFGWLHLFLWGMSEGDQRKMIEVILGRTVEPAELAGVAEKHGLKSWSDFPEDYKEPPFRVEEDNA